MKSVIRLISTLMVFVIAASLMTACLSSGNDEWQERFDKAVVKGKAKNVIIRYDWVASSILSYEVVLERDKVASFVELFKDISFGEFSDADEIMKLSISVDQTYVVDFIIGSKVSERDDASAYDETGSRFENAVQVRVVKSSGYVYLREATGDGEKWYKSNETVNVDKLLEYYGDAPRYEG